jgi:hypothetical protein
MGRGGMVGPGGEAGQLGCGKVNKYYNGTIRRDIKARLSLTASRVEADGENPKAEYSEPGLKRPKRQRQRQYQARYNARGRPGETWRCGLLRQSSRGIMPCASSIVIV